MAGANMWKQELSFADRMQQVMNLAIAYQAANSEQSSEIARTEAALAERRAHDDSSTLEEYLNICAKLCEELSTTHASDGHALYRSGPNEKDDADGLSPAILSGPAIDLGPYKDCRHIYTGPFSSIYVSPSPSDPRHLIAIKSTNPQLEEPPHDSWREAKILASLTHPNIISLQDETFVPKLNALLLSFAYRPFTLDDILRSWSNDTSHPTQSTLSRLAAAQQSILTDLFTGLAYLHQNGIIHRDIKPANILFSRPSPAPRFPSPGPAQIADFGIAWSAATSDTAKVPEPPNRKITDVGTTCYRAPELLFGCCSYSTKIDMWAAGCVAAEVFVQPTRRSSPSLPHAGSSSSSTASWTLFDAGPLGSDLSLIKSIFSTLGTPDAESWPEITATVPGTDVADAAEPSRVVPDWGKMTFAHFSAKSWGAGEVMAGITDAKQIDLVRGGVKYHMAGRLTAREVLTLPYFTATTTTPPAD